MSKTTKLLKQIKKPIAPVPIGGMVLPNHSGDHTKGHVRTQPTQDLEIVNKKYVDDGFSPLGHTHTHASATGQTTDDHHNESHTAASHSDQTSTGAQVDTAAAASHAETHTIASHSDTQTSISASTDALDVENVKSVTVDTTGGNIVIGGLANGVTGQIVHIVKIDSANFLTIEHDEATGTQKIMTNDGANITLGNFGGVNMIYNGTYWYVVSE